MEKAAFVTKFGSVFEHSPWVAERGFDVWQKNSGACNADKIHAAMTEAFSAAPQDMRLELLKAHPDLAGKLAQAKRLTEASTAEQASAGLDALTDDERDAFTQLNSAYVAKFSFPFIIAVRDHTKASILEAFHQRINNDEKQEFEEACKQVGRIAYFRLKDMVEQ